MQISKSTGLFLRLALRLRAHLHSAQRDDKTRYISYPFFPPVWFRRLRTTPNISTPINNSMVQHTPNRISDNPSGGTVRPGFSVAGVLSKDEVGIAVGV